MHYCDAVAIVLCLCAFASLYAGHLYNLLLACLSALNSTSSCTYTLYMRSAHLCKEPLLAGLLNQPLANKQQGGDPMRSNRAV